MKVFTKIGLLLLTISLFSGCRKEIEHELGLWKIVETSTGVQEAEWNKMPGAPENIYSLQSFENRLYMAGEDLSVTDAFLYYLTDTTFRNALSGTMISGPITDLQVVGNRMWAGGSFSYFQSFKEYENLLYVENGSVSGMKFGDWLYSEIEGLTAYNNDLLVRGWFNTSSSLHTGIKTSYVERVSGNSVVGFGTDVLKERVNDFCVHENKVYVSGEGQFIANVHLCGFWDGSKWQNSGVFDKSGILDNGFGIASFGSDLFLVHDKTWATTKKLVQRFDGSDWQDVDEVSVFGGKRTKFKVIENNLYFFGEGLTLEGALESNVLKFDGTSWTAVGALTRAVTDVEIHDGILYASTKDGLYEFK